jgi:solute carrier family 45, member 1/2/4
LFFSTVYLGEIYVKEQIEKDPRLSPEDPTLQADATRAGSRALLWSSILSLASSILLPYLVMQAADALAEKEVLWHARSKRKDAFAKLRGFVTSLKPHSATLWAFSNLLFALTMWLTLLVYNLYSVGFYDIDVSPKGSLLVLTEPVQSLP